MTAADVRVLATQLEGMADRVAASPVQLEDAFTLRRAATALRTWATASEGVPNVIDPVACEYCCDSGWVENYDLPDDDDTPKPCDHCGRGYAMVDRACRAYEADFPRGWPVAGEESVRRRMRKALAAALEPKEGSA